MHQNQTHIAPHARDIKIFANGALDFIFQSKQNGTVKVSYGLHR